MVLGTKQNAGGVETLSITAHYNGDIKNYVIYLWAIPTELWIIYVCTMYLNVHTYVVYIMYLFRYVGSQPSWEHLTNILSFQAEGKKVINGNLS